MMGRVELDPDGCAPGTGVDLGGVRAEGLGEDAGRAAVQQAERLGVAGHGHRAHGALGAHLGDRDAHAFHQGAGRGRQGGDVRVGHAG